MFGLKKHGPDGRYGAIIDIGSGSVGVGISSVSVSVLGAKEGSPSTVPAPMTLVLMLSGLALLVRTTQRKT